MVTSSDMPLVLYVEDEDDNFVIAELRLRGRFQVIRAATDREACDMVRRHAGELRAVLMDLQLKGAELDGGQLTRLFMGQPVGKTLPAWAQGLPQLKVPVFVVTAYGATLHADADVSSAASLFSKPVDYRQLIKALQAIPKLRTPMAAPSSSSAGL
jgi:CheY-like chemotaxis protein